MSETRVPPAHRPSTRAAGDPEPSGHSQVTQEGDGGGTTDHTGPGVVRTAVATTDPDEVLALASSIYGVKRLRLAGDRRTFSFRHTRTDLGRARLDTWAHTETLDIDLGASCTVFVTRISRRALELDSGAGPQRFGPGDILIGSHWNQDYRATARGVQTQICGIDLSLLRDVAGREVNPEWVPPREAFGRRFDPATARSWQHTVDYVRSVVDEQSLTTPLVLGTVRRLLAATLLAAVSPPADPSGLEGRDATPTTVQRAIGFIESNPDLDIGVAEIAVAAHVTPRAIQLAFRRHLDTTPMAYLRRVRLDRARADLLAAVPGDGSTVTSIAARWGFPQASRFAQHYRAAYGEPPSATLRR